MLNIYGVGYPNEELTMSMVQSSGNGHDDVIIANSILEHMKPMFEEYERMVRKSLV